MRHRTDYFKFRDLLPKAKLDAKAVAILDDFGRYFHDYPSHAEIDMATFLPKFQRWHPDLTIDQFNQYKAVLLNSVPLPDDDQRRNILNDLSELDLMTSLANLAEQWNDGDLADPYGRVTLAIDGYRKRLGIRASPWIDADIGELLQDEFDDSGVSWRLSCLNDAMRRLRPGDFGIVAGRPDKGKTTFLTSEVTNFAPQLPPERNIVWLNNEGPGRRIIPRLYQSALNLTMDEMKTMHAAGRLVDAYVGVVGRTDRIRVMDIHGYTVGQVEALLEENNPGVIIYDMIDNIRGFGDQPRTDLILEHMYQWARERSVKYDCIGIASSQISNEGDGLMFPTLGMLKDSKTGKQGACDFQLMIGASNDIGLQDIRYIGLPKNKLRRPSAPGDPRAEVMFDGSRARYCDIPLGS